MTKPTKYLCVQLSLCLGIRMKIRSLVTYKAHSEYWSDWADAQADPSLRWAHKSFCWICHAAAQFPSWWSEQKYGGVTYVTAE